MRKKTHLFILMLLLSITALAQQKAVTGKVTDDLTGDPLPGASVIVKGTTTGTVTDVKGEYSIKADAGATLTFSYLGYESTWVKVGAQTVINVVLKTQSVSLGEVVAIGYGVSKKRDLTGAISSVKGKELQDKPFSGVDQALQGKVSGVTVTQNSGAPGGGVSLRIRGIASLTGSNEPLYVVDGVPIDGGANNESFNFSTLGGGSGQLKTSAMSNINPADIASIEVLKDASAAAIYGSRASNGVVLITTKKGEKGESKVSYDAYFGIQKVAKYLDVMNLRDFASYFKDVQGSLGRPVPFELQNPELLGDGTNWQKEIFRTAPISSHQLSISGGKDKTKFYTSLSVFNQDGIVINSDFKRESMRLNLDHEVNKWISIGNSVSFNHSLEHITLNDDESGVISSALRQSPEVPVRYSDGSWGGPTDGLGVGSGRNPVAWSEIRNNRVERFKLNGNFFVNLKLLKDLSFRTELGYDYNTSKTNIFNPTYEIGSEKNTLNSAIVSNSGSLYWIFKNYANYDKSFNKHTINFMLGQEAQQSKWNGISARRDGFLTNDVTTLNQGDFKTATNDEWKGTWSMLSYFGRANYSFAGKYLFTGTLRADASSNFGPNNRWGYFPSFSFAWVASEESFMKSIKDVVSLLKIRGGYGEVGNQAISPYAYGASLRSVKTTFGTGFAQANLSNPDVKWETGKSLNIGLELGLLNNKIKMDLDLYKKTSADFLFILPMPSYLGAQNVAPYLGLRPPYVNLGEMQNKGIDFSLITQNISKVDLSWTSTFIISAYRNKLVRTATDGDVIFTTFEFNNTLTKTAVGQPVGQFYGYQTNGLFLTEADLRNSPSQGSIDKATGIWVGDIKYKNNESGDNVIDDKDRTYIGNPHPDFTFSINNNVNYKNFELSLALGGTYGNQIYNWTRKLTEGMREVYGNQALSVNNRFIEGVNENTNMPRYAAGDPNNNSRVSDRFIEDGSYLRIQNLTVAYSLNKDYLRKLNYLSKLRIYASAQNLYTFTNYTGYDPEVGAYGQSALLMGVDNGRYPSPRTFTLGLNVSF